MIDALRLFLNRPLDDRDRPRLFAIVVALIVAIAAAFAFFDDSDPAPRRHPEPAPTAATPAAPSEESDARAATRPDVAHSKRAARRFLVGYLRHGYGRATAIHAATPALRAQLAHERPRVPPAERRRHPRLELLDSDTVSHERAEVIALIGDGTRRYTVHLQLANTPSGWLVSAVEH